MARIALRALACASLVFFLCPAGAVPADRPVSVSDRLAMQTALQKGRELLGKDQYEAAVFLLEKELDRINGNRDYLAALRDAYRGYIRQLRLAGKDADVATYERRLKIIDPGAPLDQKAATAKPAAGPAPAVREEARAEPVKARGKREDEPSAGERSRLEAQELLKKAHQEFDGQRYAAALGLYEKAHQADSGTADAARERWAYCKFYQVVQRFNGKSADADTCRELEKEVRDALALAPTKKLKEYGNDLLDRIHKRQAGDGDDGAQAPEVTVRFGSQKVDGYDVAETSNFRVLYHCSRDVAEKAATIAEKTRWQMHRRWFGRSPKDWNPKCDLVLHADGDEYSRKTQAPRTSPGHSTFEYDQGRVMSRRVELHCDDSHMLTSVLPHETTHAVLAGQFGGKPVPRWVDEGVAVLSEPRERIERHLKTLPGYRRDRTLWNLEELVTLNDYPRPQYVGAFYAQSVSVVEFLSKEKGPKTFTDFVREGIRSGYDKALTKYYDYKDFDELQKKWIRVSLDGQGKQVVAGKR